MKTNLTRLQWRASVGDRPSGTAPVGKWGTQTFTAGLTQNALIAPWVNTGVMNGPAFDAYIETQLAPLLDPGAVVTRLLISSNKMLGTSHKLSPMCPPQREK